MPINFDKLLSDPMFAGGAGLFGAGSPIATAYGLMQQTAAVKRAQQQQAIENAQQEAMLGWRNRQLSAQEKNYESEAEARSAQAMTARANAEKYGEQVKVMQAAEERKARNEEFMRKLMPGLFNGQNGLPDLGGAMTPQSGGVPDPSQPMPTGKFGTPVAILDNLQKVESGGNPFAMGPDIGNGVRAKGPYQFLDSTRASMEQQGYGQFDPFNPSESRDAADWYLQKLFRQNGGDWQKALAAYGGFKTKDASQYVNKVLTGSPESVVRQVQQNQSNPGLTLPAIKPTYTPNIKLHDGDMTVDLNASYEPAKMALDIFKTTRDYGPGGFKEQEASRQNRAEQRATEKHPGELAGQAANIAHTQAQTTRLGQQTADDQRKEQEARAMAKNSHDAIGEAVDAASNQIDSLISDKGLPAITGRAAMTNRFAIPGGAAYEALAKLKSIQSKLVQDTLQAVRAASKNGASGYGQFTEKELEVVKTYIDNLDPGRPDFIDALKNVKGRLAQIKARQGEYYRAANAPSVGTVEGGYRFKGGDPADQKNWEKQ